MRVKRTKENKRTTKSMEPQTTFFISHSYKRTPENETSRVSVDFSPKPSTPRKPFAPSTSQHAPIISLSRKLLRTCTSSLRRTQGGILTNRFNRIGSDTGLTHSLQSTTRLILRREGEISGLHGSITKAIKTKDLSLTTTQSRVKHHLTYLHQTNKN